MGRYITTIGLRPECVEAYIRIKNREGNFSEWISNLILAIDAGDEGQIMLIDALRRQLKALKGEINQLYKNNGVVRKELTKQIYLNLQLAIGDNE